MTIVRWSPFSDFRRVDRLVNRAFAPSTDAERAWPVPLDVVKDGESFIVKASLPGVDPDKIEVTVGERGLEIKGSAQTEAEDQGGRRPVAGKADRGLLQVDQAA